MATLPPIISRTWVEATITDSLGQVNEVDSLVTDNNPAPTRSRADILVAGDNPIGVPVTPVPRGVIITFGQNCTSVKTLKGIGADTGIVVASPPANSGTFILLFGTAPPVNLIINSSILDTDFSQFQYF